MTDAQLIDQVRRAAEMVRCQSSLYSARVDDGNVAEYLDEFARGLEDLMADSLTPAEETLKTNERLRETDPKGRREFLPAEPAKSWG